MRRVLCAGTTLVVAAALTMVVVPTASAGPPRCLGEKATIIGTDRVDEIRGTR